MHSYMLGSQGTSCCRAEIQIERRIGRLTEIKFKLSWSSKRWTWSWLYSQRCYSLKRSCNVPRVPVTIIAQYYSHCPPSVPTNVTAAEITALRPFVMAIGHFFLSLEGWRLSQTFRQTHLKWAGKLNWWPQINPFFIFSQSLIASISWTLGRVVPTAKVYGRTYYWCSFPWYMWSVGLGMCARLSGRVISRQGLGLPAFSSTVPS